MSLHATAILDVDASSDAAGALFRPAPACGADAAALSPALALQQRLERDLMDAPVEGAWSPRAKLAFMALSCGAFWAVAALVLLR
jgi:hypothetical protein